MGLFKKREEVNNKNNKLATVIKNDGLPDYLIYKYHEEDFNINCTLVVNPSEKAIFIKEGVIYQVFDNGTYKLSTDNYPFISKLRNLFTSKVSTFSCTVYFVKTSHSIEIKWGTSEPIKVRDKLLGITTKLRCRGSYKVAIDNPSIFLEKLIGSNVDYEFETSLDKYFINEFQSKIKSIITRAINESNEELVGIDARLDEFSLLVEPYLQEILSSYGLRCVKFVVSAIDIDDDELRRKYDEVGMEALSTIRKAQSDKAALDILKEGYDKMKSYEILKDLANNPSNAASNIGASMGMGIASMNAINEMSKNLSSNISNDKNNNALSNEDILAKLETLKKLLDAGLIDKSEYDAKKEEILSRM